jgi:hypothetical protein
MEHLKDAPLLGKALGLPTNIRLGWKGALRTNTISYYKKFVNYRQKSFKTLALGPQAVLQKTVNVNKH